MELYPKYINNHEMHFNIYDVFYSQCFHQHVSAGISAIFRAMLLLQEYQTYKCGKLSHYHSITMKLKISLKIMQFNCRLKMDNY
jgi:hypothetical protein